MRSEKRYSNVTFTKRVDHEAGRHRPPRAAPEPRICERCGAIYKHRRWTGGVAAPREREGPAPTRGRVLCPACVRIVSGLPRGFVRLGGSFLNAHWAEIEQLLQNETARAAEDNPLARVISERATAGSRLELATTTTHLAQRIGHALQKAFGGRVRYGFSHENEVARVSWSRNED